MKLKNKREHTPWIIAGILFLAIISSYFVSQLSRKDLIYLNKVIGPMATRQKDAHAAFSQQTRLYLDAVLTDEPQNILEGNDYGKKCQELLSALAETPNIHEDIHNSIVNLQSHHKSFTERAQRVYLQWSQGIEAEPIMNASKGLAKEQQQLNKQFTDMDETLATYLVSSLNKIGELENKSIISETIIILIAVLSVFFILRNIVTKPLERLVQERTRQVREHEQEVVESENRFRQVVEHMTSGVFVCEYSPEHSDFLFKEANRSVGSMEQIPREEVLGRPLTMVFPEIRRTHYYKALQDVHATGESKLLDAYYYSNDRISGWRESFIYKLHNGELVTVYNDVTEKKIYEKRLERMNRDLQQASLHAGMAEIASGVLHNVGNTLNSVQVLSQTILERMKLFPVDGLKNTARLITSEKESLTDFLTSEKGQILPEYLHSLSETVNFEKEFIINELHDLRNQIDHMGGVVHSQQDYAKQVAVEQRVCVNEIINDALKLNEASLQRHKIKVDYDGTTDLELYIQLHKVLQVLVNLIRNAKDAMRERPLNQRTLCIKAWATDETISISVQDNGVGISQENLKKIFAHGFTTRADKGGHGFGLHSCSLVIKQLKGELHVESKGEGEGACFTISLPINPKATPSQMEETAISAK